MTRLSTEKLHFLKKAFTEDGMSPGQAAQKVGITYATAKRWYDKWADEIKRGLESRLLPSLEASVKRQSQKRQSPERDLFSKNNVRFAVPV
jgi:transposase